MATISNYFYDNVFILGFDEDAQTHEELMVFDDIDEIIAELRSRSAKENYKIRAVHGWLAPAKYIPANLQGKSTFIVVEAEDADWGMIITSDSEDGDDLAREIERVIQVANEYTPYEIGIENIGILYGQEISVTLSLDDDFIDDETSETCEAIVEEIKEIIEEM
jgi:hypothetical protein